MGNVVKLPSAPTSYLTVNKAAEIYYVVLVTPAPGKSLKTRLFGFSDRATAIEYGKGAAAKMQRPFKAGAHA